jgi:hypothetical protein
MWSRNIQEDSSRRLLLEALGAARRDRILAALYLVRQDGVVIVRQTSMQIWKALVHNTPRTGTVILRNIFVRLLSACPSARITSRIGQSNHIAHFIGRR